MADLLPGSTFGRYTIDSLLGEGGMGRVFRAHDTLLRRSVALKVVADLGAEAAVARLLREARAAASLHHPNAVTVWDAGEVDGVPYIAMELISGVPLHERMQDKTIPIVRRLRWLEQIARALEAAHQVGIVHRDVKPENVMIQNDQSVKVLDFGIAKRATEGPDVPSVPSEDVPNSYRTAQGRVLGTPRYMAPEQIHGETLDGRTDQYAWGLVAYELLSGATFRTNPVGESPPPLDEIVPEVPHRVANIVARALAQEPNDRYPSMATVAELIADQAQTLDASTIPSDPRPNPRLGARHELEMATTQAPTSGPAGPTVPPRGMGQEKTSPAPRRSWPLVIGAVALAMLFAYGAGSYMARRNVVPNAASSTSAPTAAASVTMPESASAPTIAPSISSIPTEDAAVAASAVTSASVAPPKAPPKKVVATNCRCISKGHGTLCPVGTLSPSTSCFCSEMSTLTFLCQNPLLNGACMRGPYDYSGHFNNDMCMGYRVGADGKQVMSTGTTVSCAHKCLHEKEFKGPSGAECSGVSLGGIRALGSVACD